MLQKFPLQIDDTPVDKHPQDWITREYSQRTTHSRIPRIAENELQPFSEARAALTYLQTRVFRQGLETPAHRFQLLDFRQREDANTTNFKEETRAIE